MNYNMVELVGYGDEIVSGVTASEAFGDPAPTAGATAPTPAAPQPTASPSSPPAPYDGYAQAPTPPAPAPSGPKMTAKANGMTYEQFAAAGWTDDQLRANGYME